MGSIYRDSAAPVTHPCIGYIVFTYQSILLNIHYCMHICMYQLTVFNCGIYIIHKLSTNNYNRSWRPVAEECTAADLFCLLFPQGLHCVSDEIAGTSLQSTLHHSRPFSFDSRFCNAGTKHRQTTCLMCTLATSSCSHAQITCLIIGAIVYWAGTGVVTSLT